MSGSGSFSIDVIAILNSGEETGKLPESLHRLADDYEEQVGYMVKNMGQMVQPVLLVLTIDFTIRSRDIQGHIVFLMDMQAAGTFQQLIANYIASIA